MRTMIKYLRQELKMSQKELGDKVGVTMFKGDREKYFIMEEIFIFDDDYY